MNKRLLQSGFIIPGLLGLIIGFGIIASVAATIVNSTLGSATKNQQSQLAMNYAEAGINYYLWHMSHNSTDYKDGQSTPVTPDPELGYGPYEHDYLDGTGKTTGSFTLYIKPGDNGSSVVTVRSIGKVKGGSTERTLQAKLGAPSFATYSVVSNSQLWFGDSESADGPVHSNVGVKMDGPNSSDVTASNTTYVPSFSGPGSGSTQNGVWCDPAITNPNCTTRSKTSWRYPVPSIDFNKLSADLCQLKKEATNNQAANSCSQRPAKTDGYLPARRTRFSSRRGYLITLNNNGTYNLHNVDNERDNRSNYSSALSTSLVQNNISMPENGVIFAEDNVWVRSESSGFDGRVTIASARLAVSGSTTATIVDNITYKDKYEGFDTIGIIAENNIDVAPYVPVPLEIHGALIAQSGRVQFRPNYNYGGGAAPGYINANETLSFFGSVASSQQWTWSWIRCGSNTPSCWSGFKNNETVYDENLRYSPPPSFPVTSTYDILEWREVIASP
jgi:type II secretory pathway pseudopilin PulG